MRIRTEPGRYPTVTAPAYGDAGLPMHLSVEKAGRGERMAVGQDVGGNYEHQGAICPDVDVPTVGPGAILVRCVGEGPGYVLVLPDRRRPDGGWLIDADTRPHARHSASFVLTALLDAAQEAHG